MEKYKAINNCHKCKSENLLDRYNGGKHKDEYNGYLCTDCDHEFCPSNESAS
jgi:transposase-like protein